jgi:predicted nucleotidyltransferase
MISSKNDIINIIKTNQQKLMAFGASRIGLFGSYAKNSANNKSDIDIFIEFEKGKKNFKNYTGAYLFLKELLQKDIDFITPESLSPYIGPHILKEVEYVSFHS